MSAKVTTIEGDVTKLKTTVGDSNSGLVKQVNTIQSDLDALSGGAGSISTQITNAINDLDVAEALTNYYKKSETYSKTEVDNLLSTNSTGDRAYAKQYTDELFGSIKFASNSDIDTLFV